MPNTESQRKQTGIRLPQDIRDWLARKAEANSRSLSQEITHRLKQSRAQEEQRQGAAQ